MPTEPTPPQSTPDPEEPPVPEGGLVGAFVRKLFGPSWQTSLLGYLTIGAAFTVGVDRVDPTLLPRVLVVAAEVGGPLLAGGGLLFAKDKNVTGGTRSNTAAGSAGAGE